MDFLYYFRTINIFIVVIEYIMTTVYTILPSTGTMVSEISIVLLFFFIYVVYVVYLASYGTGYKPNFVMFINFIFDNYSNANFKTYINNIVNDTKTEKFTLIKNNENEGNKLWNSIKFTMNKLVSTFFIKGNRISIVRS
jgi:hypothetical protein